MGAQRNIQVISTPKNGSTSPTVTPTNPTAKATTTFLSQVKLRSSMVENSWRMVTSCWRMALQTRPRYNHSCNGSPNWYQKRTR